MEFTLSNRDCAFEEICFDLGDPGATVAAFLGARQAQKRERGSREGRRQLGADLKGLGARGGTLPRRGVGAVAACGLVGRFRGARGEDGADKRARAVSVWARGRGRLPGAACWAGAAAGPSSWGARLGRRLAGRAGKRERRVSGRAGKRPCGPKMRKGRR